MVEKNFQEADHFAEFWQGQESKLRQQGVVSRARRRNIAILLAIVRAVSAVPPASASAERGGSDMGSTLTCERGSAAPHRAERWGLGKNKLRGTDVRRPAYHRGRIAVPAAAVPQRGAATAGAAAPAQAPPTASKRSYSELIFSGSGAFDASDDDDDAAAKAVAAVAAAARAAAKAERAARVAAAQTAAKAAAAAAASAAVTAATLAAAALAVARGEEPVPEAAIVVSEGDDDGGDADDGTYGGELRGVTPDEAEGGGAEGAPKHKRKRGGTFLSLLSLGHKAITTASLRGNTPTERGPQIRALA